MMREFSRPTYVFPIFSYLTAATHSAIDG